MNRTLATLAATLLTLPTALSAEELGPFGGKAVSDTAASDKVASD